MPIDPLVKVYVEHGGADEFWDVGFTPLQLSYAEVDVEDMRGISVHLDLETGEVTLNAGYIPDSPQGRAERSLFSEFEDSIVEQMACELKGPQVFLDRAAADAEARAERLVGLAIEVAGHELDSEDA